MYLKINTKYNQLKFYLKDKRKVSHSIVIKQDYIYNLLDKEKYEPNYIYIHTM